MPVEPFQIAIPDEALADLRQRLTRSRWPDEIEGAGSDHPPREWAERSYRVVRWTEMPRGGHFAAEEEPELLAAELRGYFRLLRQTGL